MLPPLLLLLLLLLSPTKATFTPETLPGTFRLVFGLTICPDVVTFTQPGLRHPAQTLLFDTRPIQGGTLSLIPNPRTGRSGFIRHFSVHPQVVGTYYGGVLSSRIQWDTSALGADAYFVFFKPLLTFRTTWQDVIGANQPLEIVSGVPVYWFERDAEYIVINNRCLLRRDAAAAVTQGSANPATADSSTAASCFPADATVITPGGVTRIDELSIGDAVWTGNQFSQIFAWTHRDPRARGYNYMTLTLSNGGRLSLTPGHYVYVDDVALPAEKVSVGDRMTTATGEARIVSVSSGVFGTGLYNPQTKDGDIVVDGVRVTTYTTAVPPCTAHAMLAPVRMAFDLWQRVSPRT